MNAKAEQQIIEMRRQTIGVEIEMNHITREKASGLVAEYFGTTNYDSASEYGYSSWSCKDNQGRVWKFMKDVSIVGPDSQKCELVTPILKYEDMNTLQEIVRMLRHAGAVSNPDNGCGVHIHIGANGHNARTLRNLANIMASHEDLLIKALNIDSNRINRYCKTVEPDFLRLVNRKKPKTMSQLADIWYKSLGESYGRSHHYNGSRYHILNYHATFTKGTIEFRLFQFDNPSADRKGGLHAGQLKSYIQLCLALSQMAKMSSKASCKPQQDENQKYAMRTWLLRLGFIGDEFKTARALFTKRLDGDTAFRNGRAA